MDKSEIISDNIVNGKMFVWVDKEKRILIKAQTKSEGLMISETNLISES